MKKACGCLLGSMMLLFGLLVVIPASLILLLVWMLMNCLLWVFNNGLECAAEMSDGELWVDVPGYLELDISKEWPVRF